MKAIGNKLEKFRKNKNMTLKEKAKRIGVPVSTYRDWEYGREIRGEPYLKITEVLNISLFELFGSESIQSSKEIMAKLKIIKLALMTVFKDHNAGKSGHVIFL